MKIIAAKKIGFCPGVKRAILITEQSLKEKARPVQVLGALVHNENVIENLSKKGVLFRKKIKEIKPGILIIQAHGFPPFAKNFDKKIIVKDATCPLVKKVQLLAASLLKKGCQIIIIGDKKHSEVKGINGYAKNKGIIIENQKQAEKFFDFKNKKIAVISQTTQNPKKINQILKTLKSRAKKSAFLKNNPTGKIKYFNTVCPEIKTRQREAKTISQKADKILLVGSKTSANTGQLYQISKDSGKPVYWVNSLKELKKNKFGRSTVLGLISGASADDSEIKKIKNYLLKI